jgi:hypothetical protein
MKHYNIKISHIHKSINTGHLKFHFGPSADMGVDLLTQSLSKAKVVHLKGRLNLHSLTKN